MPGNVILGMSDSMAGNLESPEYRLLEKEVCPESLATYLIELAASEPGVRLDYPQGEKTPNDKLVEAEEYTDQVWIIGFNNISIATTNDVQQEILEIEHWNEEQAEQEAKSMYSRDNLVYKLFFRQGAEFRNETKATCLEGFLSLLSQVTLDDKYSELLAKAESRLQFEHAKAENEEMGTPVKFSGEEAKAQALEHAGEMLMKVQNFKDKEWIEGLNEFAKSQGLEFPNPGQIKQEVA